MFKYKSVAGDQERLIFSFFRVGKFFLSITAKPEFIRNINLHNFFLKLSMKTNTIMSGYIGKIASYIINNSPLIVKNPHKAIRKRLSAQ